jgi:RNA polymerase sigma-70 factor, ECF subfamily
MANTLLPMAANEFALAISKARDGDADALGWLWQANNPALVRYLAGRGASSPQDLASTVWMEVARGLGRFRGAEGDFRRWLFSIARCRHIDELRSCSARRERLTGELPDMAGAADPAELAIEDLGLNAALAAVGRLPPDQRDAVLLRVVADLDVAQVASILGKSPGAVRVLTHRGLRGLAQLLKGVTPRAAGSLNTWNDD